MNKTIGRLLIVLAVVATAAFVTFTYVYFRSKAMESTQITDNINKMDLLIQAVKKYYDNYKIMPQGMSDLNSVSGNDTRWENVDDVWGNHFILDRLTEDTVFIKCLGRDGKVGGEGIDTDWVYKLTGLPPVKKAVAGNKDNKGKKVEKENGEAEKETAESIVFNLKLISVPGEARARMD